MGIPRFDPSPMTVEEFLAFTDARPDDEKWELIDGEPVLNATPSFLHQEIAGNVLSRLRVLAAERSRPWTAIAGMGVRVSDTKLPIPDVLVRPGNPPGQNPMSRECDDMIVAFEILSPSTSDRDLRWKRAAYTNLRSLESYVIIAQDAVDVVTYERAANFAERRFKTLDSALELAPLGIELKLAEIYRGTGLK
jgi:Uma2 family endonuclease